MPGATSNLAIPYPLLTDAADIEDFGVKDTADAVDTILDAAMKQYKTLYVMDGYLNNGRPSATRPFTSTAPTAGGSLNTPPSGATAFAAFHLDPARHPAGGRTLKLSVTGIVATTPTAPASDFTFALYPVTPNASPGAGLMDVVLGTVVSGSGATVSAPGVHTYTYAAGSDFNFPTAGFYALCVTNSATMTDGAFLRVELAFRAV